MLYRAVYPKWSLAFRVNFNLEYDLVAFQRNFCCQPLLDRFGGLETLLRFGSNVSWNLEKTSGGPTLTNIH